MGIHVIQDSVITDSAGLFQFMLLSYRALSAGGMIGAMIFFNRPSNIDGRCFYFTGPLNKVVALPEVLRLLSFMVFVVCVH